MLKLIGNTAIVTGGARGIGYAMADKLMEHGASVVIADVLKEDGANSAKQLTEKYASVNGAKCYYVWVDLTDFASTQEMVNKAIELLGKVEMVNCNAGIDWPHVPVWEETEDAWKKIFDIDVGGVFHTLKATIPYMIRNEICGSFVITSSINATWPTDGLSHYSAAKAAVANLAKTVTDEAGRYGIRCNAISPGLTMTDMVARFAGGKSLQMFLDRTALYNDSDEVRAGYPEDVARVNAFLHSELATWVSGMNVPVDGGAHIFGLHSYTDVDNEYPVRVPDTHGWNVTTDNWKQKLSNT